MLVKPRTLSGFKDRLPKEARAKNVLLRKVSDVFMSFGFMPIETPHLEYADILVRQGSEEIQKELYRFKDNGDRDVALRFDLTVPLARFISQYKGELDLPFKRFAIGNVFRGERAQKGRFREFTQCDFDFIGSDSIACDCEIAQVIYASMISLGIGEFTIWLNHRSILNGICEYLGIKDVPSTLRIIDKLEKIGADGVKEELKACGLGEESIDGLLKFVSIKQIGVAQDFFSSIAHMKEYNQELNKGISDLEKMYEILDALNMNKSAYRVNFSIARGLGYYTGIIYETTLNRLPAIGSVCSGGRYDNLTKSFSKESMSGVGASIGIDRLLCALEELELVEYRNTSAKALIMCTNDAYMPYAHKLAETFRQSKVPVEIYPEATKLKKQFSYANSKGHDYAIVIGDSEFEQKDMTIKNMITGMQLDNISFIKALEIIKG